MGSKLILLLGLLVGAALTLICVNDRKHTQALKYYQQSQNETTIEEVKAPEVKPAVTLQEPSFSYSLKEGMKLRASFAEDDKNTLLEQFILKNCPSDTCAQDLSFDKNIKAATWQSDALKIASFLKANEVKDGSIAIDGQLFDLQGELKDDAQMNQLNKLLEPFSPEVYKMENLTTIAPKIVIKEVNNVVMIEKTQTQVNELLANNPIYFEFNSEILTPKSQEILDTIITTVNASSTTMLRVEGHTDSGGDAAYNKKLSQKRAASVKEYLLSNGLTIDVKAIGYGEEKPISANPRESINRRVEIHLEGGE